MSLAQSFARSAFARFINTPTGRVVRVVAGLACIAWGYSQRETAAGLAVMLIGFVPLAAGAFNLCLISALLGGPIRGDRVRPGE